MSEITIEKEVALESDYDESEAPSLNPNEVLIEFQCLNCSTKYEALCP
jgi:hypothetical protein